MLFGQVKIGDRVRCNGGGTGNRKVAGKVGTIIGFIYNREGDSPLVEFDTDVDGHDGLGKCEASGEYGRCWFVPIESVEVIFDEIDFDDTIPDNLPISFDEII